MLSEGTLARDCDIFKSGGSGLKSECDRWKSDDWTQLSLSSPCLIGTRGFCQSMEYDSYRLMMVASECNPCCDINCWSGDLIKSGSKGARFQVSPYNTQRRICMARLFTYARLSPDTNDNAKWICIYSQYVFLLVKFLFLVVFFGLSFSFVLLVSSLEGPGLNVCQASIWMSCLYTTYRGLCKCCTSLSTSWLPLRQ